MLNHNNKRTFFLLVLLASLGACTTANNQQNTVGESLTITVYGSVFAGFDKLEKKMRQKSAMLCGTDTFTILERDVVDEQETVYYENLEKYERVLSITRKIECH